MYIYTHVYGGVHKRVNEFSEQVRGEIMKRRDRRREGGRDREREGRC